MKKRMISRTGVVAAACAVGALLAQPAFASQVDSYYHGTHAAVDNSPGDGAAAWLWVYGSKESHAVQGSIQYELVDGTRGSLTAGRGQTKSEETSSHVKGFRACTTFYTDGFVYTYCASWIYFS